jgi:hypothetical protein
MALAVLLRELLLVLVTTGHGASAAHAAVCRAVQIQTVGRP